MEQICLYKITENTKMHNSVKTESRVKVLFLCTLSNILCICINFHEVISND